MEPVLIEDRYALHEPIGHGGMADVYRAVDQVLGREVAVKMMRDATAGESERARFINEAQTLARLDHEGLVTVLDAGTDAAQPFLVLDLVQGQSLSACLADGPLEPERVATIGLQVAEALSYVHRCGVVHRDVKPGNVLIGKDGQVKLADFGIARLMDSTERHTRTGMTVGSPAYLAPEQVGGREVTTAADVYSLGLVLLEALTGEKAFHGTSMEIAFARLNAPPRIPEWLSPPWQELLHQMTEIDPDARPRCLDVAGSLRRLAGGADDPAATQLMAGPDFTGELTMHTLVAPVVAIARRGLRPLASRGRRVAVVAAAAVLTTTVAVGVAAARDDDPRNTERIPDGVPTRLEKPMTELRDAVYGEAR